MKARPSLKTLKNTFLETKTTNFGGFHFKNIALIGLSKKFRKF